MSIEVHPFGPFLGDDGTYILAAGHADPSEFLAWALEQYVEHIDRSGWVDEEPDADQVQHLHATLNTEDVHEFAPGEWLWLHTEPGPESEPVTVLSLEFDRITQTLPPARQDFNFPGQAAPAAPDRPGPPARPEDCDGVTRVDTEAIG